MGLLAAGLRLVAAEIGRKTKAHSLAISITDVTYAECDFQPEGLTAAMLGWAREVFHLDLDDIEVSFDRNANRYNFVWPTAR
jgi:hypothetical protein